MIIDNYMHPSPKFIFRLFVLAIILLVLVFIGSRVS